jgi:hypothetical protein
MPVEHIAEKESAFVNENNGFVVERTPPRTVLARVWLELRGPEGPYSYAQVEAALRQARIPPHAPYDEWHNDAMRAVTLLPQQETPA